MSPDSAPLARTPLTGLHESLGAKLTAFAGYAMPLQYAGGIIAEHTHTRTAAGLFDVSHMGLIRVDGDPAALERCLTGDIAGLEIGRQRYSLLTGDDGGILDDVMSLRLPDHCLVVVNAAFKHADLDRLRDGLGGDADATLLDDRALLALQGPRAAEALAPLCPGAGDLFFLDAAELEVAGLPCVVSRSGYTGEDGFEIAAPADGAGVLARALLDHEAVAPIGLGARDSLRLEAGLPLSGSDIGPDRRPVEAGLGWAVARKYRDGAQPARFPGASRVLEQFGAPPSERRVGLRPVGRVPLRADTVLGSGDEPRVGRITSGSFGPSVGHPVAMGYVGAKHAEPGTQLAATIRGRVHDVRVTTLPFVPHRYRRR